MVVSVIVLFAPIPNVAKFIIMGLLWVFVGSVWIQFWMKAKTGPLSASEEYYIEELRLRHLGRDDNRLTVEQSELQLRRPSREIQRPQNESDSLT